MDRYWLSIIVYAVCSIQLAAASSLTETAKAALNTDIELNGSSSIILEYHTFGDASRALDSMQGEARTAVIQSIHQQFLKSLSSNTAKNVTDSFLYVPGTVMSVNQSQLKEVIDSPLVKRIYRNQARRINLQQSIDLVFPKKPAGKFLGKGQTVAIIDTGVDRGHSFFARDGASRVVDGACYSGGGFTNFREAVTLCPNRQTVQIGADAGEDCTQFSFPGCDHGTHVAGIAAGNDGVASEADIIAIQVFTGLRDVFRRNLCGTGRGTDCVVAFDSDILKGLERVFALRNTYNIAAVNMSLGGGQYSSTCNSVNSMVTSIVNQLKLAGIATTASSGNSGFSSQMGWPSCISNVVAVGASSDFTGSIFGRSVTTDQRTFYSNNSSALDIYAPGTLIRSSVPENAFANFNGTSMAAPHVAGAFAVVKAQDNSLTINQIESTFKSVGPLITHAGVSRRRLDIEAALMALGLFNAAAAIIPVFSLLLDDSSPPSPPPSPPSPPILPPSDCNLQSIRLGESKVGAWTSSSPFSRIRGGTYSEPFAFALSETTTVSIELDSSLEVYFYVMRGCDTVGLVVADSNPASGPLVTRIVRRLAAGVYTIDATTLRSRQTGGFTLTLRR